MKTNRLLRGSCMAIIIAGTMLSMLACNKGEYLTDGEDLISQKLDSPKIEVAVQQTGFNRFVGAPIDRSIGTKWIRNYTNTQQGKMEYFLLMSELQKLLTDSRAVGICLYYALNEQADKILIPIALDQDGRIIKQLSVTTENGKIDWETAQKWISRFDGSIKAHFFGSNTFERLRNIPECSVIRANYALDDKGNPQALLSNAAEIDPLVYEDASRPCPPYCPINN